MLDAPDPASAPRPTQAAVAVALATLIALLAASSASARVPAPEPQIDAVTVSGEVDANPAYPGPELVDIELDVRSGPAGEEPSGTVSFDFCIPFKGECSVFFNASGPATCLHVSGNEAVLVFRDQHGQRGVVEVLEGEGSEADRFSAFVQFGSFTECSQPVFRPFPLDGSAEVSDGRPPPTAKQQCVRGGWRLWSFRNQGLCVAYTNTS